MERQGLSLSLVYHERPYCYPVTSSRASAAVVLCDTASHLLVDVSAVCPDQGLGILLWVTLSRRFCRYGLVLIWHSRPGQARVVQGWGGIHFVSLCW
jgi:hypothetical protein